MERTPVAHDDFTPLLTTTDWNEEWKALQQRRRPPDDAAWWDKRAATFRTHDAPSAYTDQFLALAAIRPDETVFDMGCGNGALALPLATAGHPVIAADFSRGMLDDLAAKAAARGVEDCIECVCLSWEDDWATAGFGANCVDVALASRSVATADLGAALEKLSSVARRRACATLTTGPSPHVDVTVFEGLGLPVPKSFDYLYALLVLTEQGYQPELRLIASERIRSYHNVEEAAASLAAMIEKHAGRAAAPDQIAAALEQLPAWVAEHLVPNERTGADDGHGGTEKALRLRDPRPVQWAFLSWDTSRTPHPAW